MLISFFVDGVPAPKGSGRAMRSYSTGKVIYRPASSSVGEAKLKAWDAAVRAAALSLSPEQREAARRAKSVGVGAHFMMPRPKRHHFIDGTIRPEFEDEPHVVKPDLDKLLRATIDGLVTLFGDDKKVVKVSDSTKSYNNCHIGASIFVEVLS